MSIRKRNEFLEGDDSGEELDSRDESGASEGEGRSGVVARGIKRRRLDDVSDADSNDGDTDTSKAKKEADVSKPLGLADIRHANVRGADFTNDSDLPHPRQGHQSLLKRSTPKQVEAARKAALKSGVIYISRVPPFMKPQTLKHFLTPHAPRGIGRIFLTPEDHVAHARRVRAGGNKKKSFTDGWVEFASKRDAKIAAESLNGNIIGGKKGNFYHDDLWNMKYLRGFKWSHLTEQIASENAERAARLREEVRKTRAENRTFVRDVERGKMLETREGKRKARLEKEGLAADEPALGSRATHFKQKKARDDRENAESTTNLERITRLGSMIL